WAYGVFKTLCCGEGCGSCLCVTPWRFPSGSRALRSTAFAGAALSLPSRRGDWSPSRSVPAAVEALGIWLGVVVDLLRCHQPGAPALAGPTNILPHKKFHLLRVSPQAAPKTPWQPSASRDR